ncbi:hypothetical protein REPUB_Repub06bG0021700 [Reevesia pubescens]
MPVNTTLLSIDRRGVGGTKLSTINPYTVLEHSIFKAVTRFFTKELSGIPQVIPVEPFGHVIWRIFGSNSMVQPAPGVSCLAFVDAELNTRASIVIGAYQMENNLVQFDLARSRLGFSSSLLFFRTSCNNFNFTASP